MLIPSGDVIVPQGLRPTMREPDIRAEGAGDGGEQIIAIEPFRWSVPVSRVMIADDPAASSKIL